MPRRYWTPEEDLLVAALYPDMPTDELADLLGRTLRQVDHRAIGHGIRKSAEYLSGPLACRFREHGQTGVKTQFKPGHQAWNKGLRYEPGGRSVETRFKPGRPPQEARNYKPIGSLRICFDGYLQRKVTDDRSICSTRRWVEVHRLVWQEANGPIPPGHVVIFKPGRKTTVLEEITLDALELVSRRELMRRNTVHNYGKDIALAVQLVGALHRQINRRKKHVEAHD